MALLEQLGEIAWSSQAEMQRTVAFVLLVALMFRYRNKLLSGES